MNVPSQPCASTPDGVPRIAESEPEARENATEGPDRRTSGRRARARDRLLDRGTQPTNVGDRLERVRDIENMLLFVDDDIRETALAMQRIEDYLTRTMQTLDHPQLRREHVLALAGDTRVLEHLDRLSETLESLRRRLARLSATMR
ncbi:MAG TPA: hypothetical protein VFG69_08640 [Nannocystaceae bacterium]|nr:hypothetical protein [Nannocystaceae bacterium]